MADKIKFSIVTPERVVHESEVDSVSVMTTSGEITVLPNHVPLVSELKPGVATVVEDGNERHMAVATGFIEVRPENAVVILADAAERAEDIDEADIEKAKAEAKKVMEAENGVNDEAYARAAAALEAELAKTKALKKRRK